MIFKPGNRVRLVDVSRYIAMDVGDIGVIVDDHSSSGWYSVKGKNRFGEFNKGMRIDDDRWVLAIDPNDLEDIENVD